MYGPERPPPVEDQGAFRSVPSQNLIRILSGELPAPGMKPPVRPRAAVRPRLTFWQRVLSALGMWG